MPSSVVSAARIRSAVKVGHAGPAKLTAVEHVPNRVALRREVQLDVNEGALVAVSGVCADKEHGPTGRGDVDAAQAAINRLVAAALREMPNEDDGDLAFFGHPRESRQHRPRLVGAVDVDFAPK